MINESYLMTLKARNTLLDGIFYDVGNLSDKERLSLTQQDNIEGSILVVTPSGPDQSVKKLENVQKLREEPGKKIRHFAIAGVGSSDLGSASLGRTLANHLQEPVGVIVSGYGLSDVLQEALGGWFFFGAIERQMSNENSNLPSSQYWQQAIKEKLNSPDTLTLVDLLKEKSRTIETLLGHSKGCLSIAYALRSLAEDKDASDWERAKNIQVTTVGAVVHLPEDMPNTNQLIGSLDWFGGINSSLDLPHKRIPNAWHHLNTQWPASTTALDLSKALDSL